MKRTHTCGELRETDIGNKVKLNGWVNSYRNLGGVLFIDLRDRYGKTQIVVDPEAVSKEILEEANKARHEFVIAVSGEVIGRPDGMKNKTMPTGD
ncbi:MAG: Asp-tRNA(Asn)/Glu-tRNA(Gln) amidotransferase GatCAB subunit C, partial [Calditrichaeota bacterium]